VKFNLQAIRKAANLTQDELAEKSGIGRVTISRIESGEQKETTSGTLVKLAQALDVSVDDLIIES